MDKDEILQKAQQNKDVVGEMERTKMNKGNWIAIIVAAFVAVAFMVAEGFQGDKASIFMLAAVCFTWASVFYFCQVIIAKRSKLVLIGAILEAVGALIMITNYVLATVGVI